jgi:hypothetical protein
MKHRNRHLILLRAILVVPFQQDIVGAEHLNDCADQVAGCSGYPDSGAESRHASTITPLAAAAQKLGGGL